MSFMPSSMGIISHVMPVGVIVHVILHIIIAIGIMGIIPPIVGIMPFIIGIMPFIMGIIPPIIGIGMLIGIMADIGMVVFIVPFPICQDGQARRSQRRYGERDNRSTQYVHRVHFPPVNRTHCRVQRTPARYDG